MVSGDSCERRNRMLCRLLSAMEEAVDLSPVEPFSMGGGIDEWIGAMAQNSGVEYHSTEWVYMS